MKNTIAERILDFLKNFPPFDVIENDSLLKIAQNVKVIYLEKGKILFEQNHKPHEYFYIVKDGALGLYKLIENDKILIDICDEGDLFGLRPLIQKDSYRLTAEANEESIVYAISVIQLKEIIKTNNKVRKYILASFSTNINTPYATNNKGDLYANIDSKSYVDAQKISYNKPIHCAISTNIQESAIKMSALNIGSIIITDKEKPIGIITDKDFRNKIVTGKHNIHQKVDAIMSSPVITFSANISTMEAQIAMMKHKIKHLCITKDGTPNSKLIGVISEHDIILLNGNSPSVLIKQLSRVTNIDGLIEIRKKLTKLIKNYIKKEIPIDVISRITSEINELLTQKAITFSLAEMPTQPVSFSWLALGSQGRKEQLLMTDQDNALVFEDVKKEDLESTRVYFIELSKKVTNILHKIGYEYCPADMMASNPKWCLSISEWKNQFNKWITKPSEESIMMCTIFFDFNLVYGNSNLVYQLSKGIFKSIDSFEIFLNYLGRNALLNPPPISFFRQFLVEHDGEHKDQFDLKSRALMPIIDAARLLVLSKKLEGKNSTIERLLQLAELEPQNKDLYLSCIHSFKILLRYRTKQGFQNTDSGRYVNLSKLSKLEKLKLKACFKPIKDIQELITVRFELAQMM